MLFLLVILMAHWLAWLALQRMAASQRHADGAPQLLVMLLLLPSPPEASPQPLLPSRAGAVQAPDRPRARRSPEPALAPTPTQDYPPTQVIHEQPYEAPTVRHSEAPASAASAPLRLELPRGTLFGSTRSRALEDLRANSGQPSIESRIAAAVGSERLTEENRGNDVWRFRKGSGCVEVHPSRDGQLDPFNQSAMPKLRSAKPC